MNIFKFEFKSQLASFISWTIVLVLILAITMVVVFPMFSEGKHEFLAVLDAFPPEFSAAFGLSVDDIFSYGGFYALIFTYISLMGASMAASVGLSCFAREKNAKCTDFLLSKPKSRISIFLAKLCTTVVILLISNIIYTTVALIVYIMLGQDPAFIARAALASSALLYVQLVILSVSIFVAVFSKKIQSISACTMAIGFSAFILTALHSIIEDNTLRYVAVYKYFDVSRAFSQGSFELKFCLFAITITIALTTASAIHFCKSNIRAV